MNYLTTLLLLLISIVLPAQSEHTLDTEITDVRWSTVIKNNKEQSINIKVLDQIPVSTNDDIEVEVEELSRAHLDEETGTCTWVMDLQANEQRQLDLKYQVKYPKRSHLIIE